MEKRITYSYIPYTTTSRVLPANFNDISLSYMEEYVTWEPNNLKIDWTPPQDTINIVCDVEHIPTAIKIVDKGYNYYFIKDQNSGVVGMKDGKSFVSMSYSLDIYCTLIVKAIKKLEEDNIEVYHQTGFRNRYTKNEETGEYQIDFLNDQFYLTNKLDLEPPLKKLMIKNITNEYIREKNTSKIKNFLYAQDLYNSIDNNWNINSQPVANEYFFNNSTLSWHQTSESGGIVTFHWNINQKDEKGQVVISTGMHPYVTGQFNSTQVNIGSQTFDTNINIRAYGGDKTLSATVMLTVISSDGGAFRLEGAINFHEEINDFDYVDFSHDFEFSWQTSPSYHILSAEDGAAINYNNKLNKTKYILVTSSAIQNVDTVVNTGFISPFYIIIVPNYEEKTKLENWYSALMSSDVNNWTGGSIPATQTKNAILINDQTIKRVFESYFPINFFADHILHTFNRIKHDDTQQYDIYMAPINTITNNFLLKENLIIDEQDIIYNSDYWDIDTEPFFNTSQLRKTTFIAGSGSWDYIWELMDRQDILQLRATTSLNVDAMLMQPASNFNMLYNRPETASNYNPISIANEVPFTTPAYNNFLANNLYTERTQRANFEDQKKINNLQKRNIDNSYAQGILNSVIGMTGGASGLAKDISNSKYNQMDFMRRNDMRKKESKWGLQSLQRAGKISAFGSALGIGTNIASTAINGIFDKVSNDIQKQQIDIGQEVQERNLNMQYDNIKASPVSEIGNFNSNVGQQNLGILIYKFAPFDVHTFGIMEWIYNYGYPLMYYGSFNDYKNRKLANIIHLNTIYNKQDYIDEFLQIDHPLIAAGIIDVLIDWFDVSHKLVYGENIRIDDSMNTELDFRGWKYIEEVAIGDNFENGLTIDFSEMPIEDMGNDAYFGGTKNANQTIDWQLNYNNNTKNLHFEYIHWGGVYHNHVIINFNEKVWKESWTSENGECWWNSSTKRLMIANSSVWEWENINIISQNYGYNQTSIKIYKGILEQPDGN